MRRQQIEAEKRESKENEKQEDQIEDKKPKEKDDDDSDDSSENEAEDALKNPQHKLHKDQVFDIYHKCFEDVPDQYNFVIQSNTDTFPKGSQIYLCYGRMSNRDALKRYGFCLTYNKYNHMTIKLRLEQNDPDFRYRHYVIQKFFSIDNKDPKGEADFDLKNPPNYDESQLVPLGESNTESNGRTALAKEGDFTSLDVQSRHFRIYY